MHKQKAVALVTVLIAITILTITAGIVLTLMTSEAMLVENQIRRIKSSYAAEGMMWKYFDNYARNGAPRVSTNDTILSLTEDILKENGLSNAFIYYEPQTEQIAVKIKY